MTRTTLILMALLAWTAVLGCSEEPRPQRLPTVEMELAGRKIAVEVAAGYEERCTGLMYRKKLAPDEGMLFVFRREQPLSFYMKNTYAPLSIAFLRDDGTILNIAHMQPLSLASHPSRLPCRYALEMPQGWFEKHGLKEGDKVGLPSGLEAAD